MTDHPITPPLVLVFKWAHMLKQHPDTEAFIAAARWGANQELEACCDWLCEAKNHGLGYDHGAELASKLHTSRRPKPPSMKEQALLKTNAILNDPNRALLDEVREALELNRRALEALPND